MFKKEKITYLMMAIVFILVIGVIMSDNRVLYTVEEINADNSLINGKTLSGGEFTGLRLANITLRNTAFKNMVIYESDFTDVTFENCTFSSVDITKGRFNNVIFKDGIMTYSGSRANRESSTVMNAPVFNNVIFDNVRMDNAEFYSVSGSSLTWRNMRDFRDYRAGSIIAGYRDMTINLKVDNCELTGVSLAVLRNDSTIYITNSKLKDSGFGSSNCKIIYVENCILNSAYLGWPQLLVVKGSTVRATAGNAAIGKAYFVDNKYLPRTVIEGGEVHILGGNAQATFSLRGGNIYIYDVELVEPVFMNVGYSKLESVNLRNVKIQGGEWNDVKIHSGIWENVEIYPAIKVKPPVEISDLKAHNLNFPQGNPFVSTSGSPVTLNIQGQRYDQPFGWPEIHVPTAQELGLTD